MPYLARKSMILDGKEYARGAVLPDKVVKSIPAGRFGAMVRTGILEEDLSAAKAAEGEMCPVCKSGPFARLQQHISLKHESAEDLAEVESVVTSDAAPSDDESGEDE